MVNKTSQYQDLDSKYPLNSGKVETYKAVERFKLSIWIAKVFSSFVFVVGTIVIASYMYLVITTNQLADLVAVGALLSGFFEVIKVVLTP